MALKQSRLRVTSSFGREMEVTLRSYGLEKYFSYLLTFRGEIWYDSRRYCLPHLKGPGTFQILFDGKEHPSLVNKNRTIYRRNHEQNNIYG